MGDMIWGKKGKGSPEWTPTFKPEQQYLVTTVGFVDFFYFVSVVLVT